MPFTIERNDITKMKVDVIVNSTNPKAIIVGGVDEAIQKFGGQGLINARKDIGLIKTGSVEYTEGYRLDSNYVYHTVSPVFKYGSKVEIILLYSCYMNSLLLAKKMKQNSIAFPLLSVGAFGFPAQLSLDVATKAFKVFLKSNDMDIHLVVYDTDSYLISKQLYTDITSYIDEHAVIYKRERRVFKSKAMVKEVISIDSEIMHSSLEDNLESIDGTFQETLFKLIDERGYKDSFVYKKANMDRRLFAKIRKDRFYHPSKNTVLSLCIALELNVKQTKDLLSRSGYDLSMSIHFDIIIHYFLRNHNYDIFEINEALFSFDQELLGYVRHYNS